MSHQYGPGRYPQTPPRPSTGWSVAWALVPLFTFGIGTPFVIGHAARRLRSPGLTFATVLYGVAVATFLIGAVTYGDSELIPTWLDTTMTIGLLGSWIGGLGHTLIIRGAVFRRQDPPRQAAPYGTYEPYGEPYGTKHGARHGSPHEMTHPSRYGSPYEAPRRPPHGSPAEPPPGSLYKPYEPHESHETAPRGSRSRYGSPPGPYAQPRTPTGSPARPTPAAHGTVPTSHGSTPAAHGPTSVSHGTGPVTHGAGPVTPYGPSASHGAGPVTPYGPPGPHAPATAASYPAPPVPGREPASPWGPRPGEPPYGTSRIPAHHAPAHHAAGPYDRPSPAGTFPGAGGPAGSLHGHEGREGHDGHDGHRDRGGRHDGHDRRDPQGGHDHEERRLGPYRLIGTLGRGGQGTVHLALTPRGEKVAIKVLHEHFTGDPVVRERFIREVEATRRVATFSTARVLDVNITDDQAYVVSEYVDGVSLEQLVRDQGPRTEDGLTRLALATAGALAAIHRAGVVHRDFKPANVLIGGDGPRVIDFGIARALDQATATATGSVIGTPAYMSPEQISGEHVGPESDVFSWASTMIFAASGRTAFGADTIPAILNRVISHHPDLSSLPSSLRPLAAACLDKRPANRPTAADIMLRIVH
ncbi:serine/threonine-protein kinase [Streptosporangium sandarakinum]|uniref:serine/threonine-protein kinase n=1 Tax=Streptosporangium sandarakinum TaxID=1260955 RepID=UPI00343B041B